MRTSRLFRALVVAGVAGTLSLGALAPMAGASVAPAAATPKWAKTVCTSIGTWLDTLDGAATKAMSGTAASSTTAKKKLVTVLGQATTATNALVVRLGKAGAPAVPDGKALAKTLRDQYRQLAKSLKGGGPISSRLTLPIRSPSPARRGGVEDAFESAFEQSQAAFNAAGSLDAPPLVDAFLAEKACVGLTGQ